MCHHGNRRDGRPSRAAGPAAKLEPLLAEINERLSAVVIEQLLYTEVIARYDPPETLF